ncbi:hypothetical protein HGRIS_005072 [Hohenbuehelia grisea]
MLPAEWKKMGGETCNDCASCIASEFALVEAYPEEADGIFDKHWETWFNQNDVDEIAKAGINLVRIPLGYWLVEALVDRKNEFYPRGGLRHLRRGLRQLHEAGIVAILDHHALPGVQTANQMFTGRCTTDVQFYTPHNYHRALVWTAVMTALSHLDPAFENAVSIQAVNEPIMDANKTPDYGEFQHNFVQTVRAVERLLTIVSSNFTAVMERASRQSVFNEAVNDALAEAAGILVDIAGEYELDLFSNTDRRGREQLITNFMDVNWQFNNPANPADAAIGPQAYDGHLYYSFGGVADANEEAYLADICNTKRIDNDVAKGNSPLWFGEWALSTQFKASDEFLFKWADAQKLAYSASKGWIFWNFKVEVSPEAGDLARQWSYLEGVRRGFLTQDPSDFHDPHVCDPYRS